MTLSLTSLLEWNDPAAKFFPTKDKAVSRGSSSAGQWKTQHHARSRDAIFPMEEQKTAAVRRDKMHPVSDPLEMP